MAVSKVVIFGLVLLVVGAGIGLGVYFGTSGTEEDVTVSPDTTESPETTASTESTPTSSPETTSSPPKPNVPITPRTAETSKYPWTPLDEYVWKEDDTFSWEILPGYPIQIDDEDGSYLHYTLNVTTQTWQNSSLFSKTDCSRNDYVGPCDCSIWWHYVSIAVPLDYISKISSGEINSLQDAGFILIGSGSYRDSPREPESEQPNYTAKIALATNSIGISIRNVPHQPCIFEEDPIQKQRSEDEIIAYTWRKFIDNPDWKDFPLRNPMTKSVVKVMDAVQEFMFEEYDVSVGRFCVTGASKRGWTSWTVAAVDYERVKCVMPVMMDTINLTPVLHNHYRSLGNWTVQFADYWLERVLGDLDSDGFEQLKDIIDPYSYRERYGDHLVNYMGMGNDEFFLPDDSWFYWDGLGSAPVQNYFQMVPNCGHDWSCSQDKLWEGSIGLYYSFMAGIELPKIYYKRWGGEEKGKVEVRSNKPFSKASVWKARSYPGRRDFRKSGFDWECFFGKYTDPDNYDPDCVEEPYYLDEYTGYSESEDGLITGYNQEEDYYFANYVFSMPESTEKYYYTYFIDVELEGPLQKKTSVYDNIYKLTSLSGITPESLPFEDCGVEPGKNCQEFCTFI